MGAVKNTGLVEVPLGISLKDMVEVIGGGARGKRPIKAVQTGGPSGGCIPATLFNIPVDYEKLGEAGAMMGSGGMIVIDESTCIVDLARFFRFLYYRGIVRKMRALPRRYQANASNTNAYMRRQRDFKRFGQFTAACGDR